MENIPLLYLLFVFLGCLLAIVAIWSRKRLWIRAGAVAALVALVILNYGALVNLLGRPQPVESFASSAIEDESVVIAASIQEGHAIYLWLRFPNEWQPHYYKMDWSHEDAVALKQAMDRSSREGSSIMMRPNYETSLETKREPLFYTLPHERLPLKPPPEIYEYRNPDNTI